MQIRFHLVTLMRFRIQVTKMMRIQADPDPQHCLLYKLLTLTPAKAVQLIQIKNERKQLVTYHYRIFQEVLLSISSGVACMTHLAVGEESVLIDLLIPSGHSRATHCRSAGGPHSFIYKFNLKNEYSV